MNTQPSVAVVGVGHFGELHARKFAALPSAKLVAVADTDSQRAAEVGNLLGVKAVTNHRDLLDAVDAVSIAVPTAKHYEIAKDFLEHDIDVLVEKPICHDAASGRKLVEIARRRNRILQVGHIEHFSGMIEALRKHISRPLYIDSVRIAPFKPRGIDVNVIFDLMIHDLDHVLCLVDSPILSVDAAGAPVFSASEDIVSARIKFASGCIANIVASRISLKTERRMRFFEAESYVTVDFDHHTIKAARKAVGNFPPVDFVEENYCEGDPLEREIEAFLYAVIHRKEPKVTGERGLEALHAAILVDQSLHEHAAFVRDVDGAQSGSVGRDRELVEPEPPAIEAVDAKHRA